MRITGTLRVLRARYGVNVLRALQSTAALWNTTLLVICFILLAGYGPVQESADALLSSLISIQKLTLYYWGQDRLGSVLPLLTAWIQDPVGNVYAQLYLRIVAAIISPTFFCALVFRRAIDIWSATVLANGLLLIAGNPVMLREIYIEANPYGTSLAFAGLASLFFRSPSVFFGRKVLQILGAICVLAAYVVNVGMVILALPLAGLFAMVLPSADRTRLVLIHLLAAIVALLLPHMVPEVFHTITAIQPSLSGTIHYGVVVWDAARRALVLAVACPLVLLAFLRRRGGWHAARLYLTLTIGMLSVALLYFLLTAWSQWVVMNNYSIRYFVPAYLLMLSVSGVSIWVAAVVLVRDSTLRRALFIAVAVAMLVAGYRHSSRWGPAPNDIIGNGKGDMAREVASRYVFFSLDGIVGDYWDVWPAVLMAEQYQYDNGQSVGDVLGIAWRGAVRRQEFLARLAERGRLKLACINLVPANCASSTSSLMAFPGLRFRELSPMQRLSSGYTLQLIEITPPDSARAG